MAQKLYDQVREYVANYLIEKDLRGGYLRKRPATRSYTPYTTDSLNVAYFAPALITHVLADHGYKGHVEDVGRAIRDVFGGKRVFEVGCRYGGTLEFLKAHGATVGGNTDERRAGTVQTQLGRGSLIIQARAEELAGSKELRDFKPHFVLSGGLFSRDRTTLDTRAALGSFAGMVEGGASVYILPSRFGASQLNEGHWAEMRKTADISRNTFTYRDREHKTFRLRRPGA